MMDGDVADAYMPCLVRVGLCEPEFPKKPGVLFFHFPMPLLTTDRSVIPDQLLKVSS